MQFPTKTLTIIALSILTISLVTSLFIWAPHERNDFPLFRDFIVFFATTLLLKYFVYMIISPWYDVVMRRRQLAIRSLRGLPYRPRVSVIIPAWNEEVGILATLGTILASTYTDLEVVVVNDGSTDDSDAQIQAFVAEYEKERASHEVGKHVDIIYRRKENGGKGRALNYGIALSSGEIIVSVDADCVLEPNTIENFVKYFEDPTVMAAVGNVKIGNTKHILGTLQYLEFLFSFYFKKADSLMNTIYIIGGAAGAFRRSVFDTVGLYNKHTITEDIDLSVRIQEAGMKIVYAADAIVYTEGAGTLGGLMQQRLRWKYGRFQTFFEHRKLFFSSAPRHNKFLTWLILPFAILGDTQLFFEIMFLIFLYIYSLLTHDFSSFASGIIVVSSMFFVQMFDDRSPKPWRLYILAPVGWLLFYITTFIEYQALLRSISAMFGKQRMKWQTWERAGLDKEELVVSESYAKT